MARADKDGRELEGQGGEREEMAGEDGVERAMERYRERMREQERAREGEKRKEKERKGDRDSGSSDGDHDKSVATAKGKESEKFGGK